MKFYNTGLEEQETHIWIDPLDRIMKIYTSRPITYERILKKLGEPNKKDTINGTLVSGTWEIELSDKRLASVFNKTTLVGYYTSKK